MSNLDTAPAETLCAGATERPLAEIRMLPGRQVPLGGLRSVTVSRLLPQRELPTVGAWCFLDVAGPSSRPADILPHPHIGLQTVTWPLTGQVRHRDTLGSDVIVRPAELNLMTSGNAIAHSEFSVEDGGPLHFVQLWVALPEHRRHGPAAFAQHRDLPVVGFAGGSATVFIGELAGARSPAEVHTPLLGADLVLGAGAAIDLPVDPDFEHAVHLISGAIQVDGRTLEPGPLWYLGAGRDRLAISTAPGARLVLLGGTVFAEELVMWWNFVGRSHEEIEQARADWEAHSPRFGEIPAHGDERIPAPPLPAVRLTARRRRAD